MATVLDHALQEYLVPVEDSDYDLIKPNGLVKSHRLAALVCDLKPSRYKSQDPIYMDSLFRSDTRLGYVFEALRDGMRLGKIIKQDKPNNPETGEESFLIRADDGIKWLKNEGIKIPDKVEERIASVAIWQTNAEQQNQRAKKPAAKRNHIAQDFRGRNALPQNVTKEMCRDLKASYKTVKGALDDVKKERT